MATLLADVATSFQAGGLSNAVLNGLIDARLKAYLESYTILGTETAASTLDVGATVLSGSLVVGFLLYVSTDQTSLTVSIGDDASATRYASAITSLQTAGTYIVSGQNYKTGQSTGDLQMVITTGGATMTVGQLEIAIITTQD